MQTNNTDIARPFLPTKDMDISRAFYQALGFKIVLDSEVVIFEVGATSFILQRYYEKTWAENTMMQLIVDDLDARWAQIAALDLATNFKVQPPKPPKLQPWGLGVAFIYDPCGVLWHFAERRPGHPADG